MSTRAQGADGLPSDPGVVAVVRRVVRPRFAELAVRRDELTPFERGELRAYLRSATPDEHALLAGGLPAAAPAPAAPVAPAAPPDAAVDATGYERGVARARAHSAAAESERREYGLRVPGTGELI
jgi:hypothetical protein